MACAKCPYTSNYELLWRDAADPEVICVRLHCCSGPELQIRRGRQVLLSEILTSAAAVVARAAELKGIDAATLGTPSVHSA
jgi:hypothetical protein